MSQVSFSINRPEKFQNIARACTVTPKAAAWYAEHNIKPPTENKLEVRNEGETVEMLLLGVVGESDFGSGGITEKEIRDALKYAKGKPVVATLNSPGGDVFQGLGIYHAFQEHGEVTCKITGCALSIASVFPCGAKRTVIPDDATMMMHCAWSLSAGNASDKRRQAEMLDKCDEALVSVYEKKTGKSKAQIKDMMEKETWLTGAEARELGLGEEPEQQAQNSSEQTILAAVKRDTQPSTAPSPDSKSEKTGAQPPEPVTTAAAISAPSPEQMNQPTAAVVTGGTNQPTPMPETNTPAAAQTTANDALEQVKAQLASERKARITAEVTRRAENKIKNDQLDKVVAMAMADEQGAYAFIDSLPVAHVGSEPLGAGNIEVGGSTVLAGWGEKPTPTVENIFKTKNTQAARYNEIKNNWNAILAEAFRKDNARPGIYNANTYSATLTTSFLVLGATTQLSPKFAAIKAFSRDVSVDPYKPLATGVMKFTTSPQDGSNVLTNATNFAQSTAQVDAVSVTVSQYTAPNSVTNADLNSGIRMEDISTALLNSLGSKIIQVATAPITVANYSTLAGITSAPETFGFSEARQLWGQLKKANTRNLILDGEYAASLLNQPIFFQPSIDGTAPNSHWTNVFGWDNIYVNTDWSGAGASVRGFACDPQAIGVIAGLPLVNGAGIPGGILSVSTGVIPGAQLPIAAYMWFETSSRTYYVSFDVMFGASKMDATAGAIIKSA